MKLINKFGWKFRQLYQRLFYWLEWRYSVERHDPYRCCECGSTDVEMKVWSKLNEGGRITDDCEESEHNYCNACQENVRIRPTSSLVMYAEEWWEQADIEVKEEVTGILVAHFEPEDVREGFDYACDMCWDKFSDEEKIQIWLKN